MFYNLKNMGADIVTVDVKGDESMVIKGKECLRGSKLCSFSDHRTAMSLVIAALAANGSSQIDNIDCVDKSFPGFFRYLKKIVKY